MARLFSIDELKARRLDRKAERLEGQGQDEAALALYREAVRLAPSARRCYNLALRHKYRNEWQAAFDLNLQAYRLNPSDEATRWNLGIAATALRDWDSARKMWRECGMVLQGDSGEINDDFGPTPVRLNPDDDAEVVWARRLGPVRARIESIPMAGSGFRHGDIVLHDGAPVGYRLLGDVEKPVFNVLELFQPSAFSTWRLRVHADAPGAVEALEASAGAHGLVNEDWTANFRMLCKACSEGRPHDHDHDHGHGPDGEWQAARDIGVAAETRAQIDRWLAAGLPAGVRVLSLDCELDAS